MKKIRAQFERTENAKYVSHLDMIRAFERAFRRAGIRIAYSEGFNPHPKIIFAMPMSVGLKSQDDYLDFETEMAEDVLTTAGKDAFLQDMTLKINASLPDGLKIKSLHFNETAHNLMLSIAYATYKIKVEVDDHDNDHEADFITELEILLKRESITVEKKAKKGMKTIDIKPLIQHITIEKDEPHCYILNVSVRAGAEDNLRPDIMVKAFAQAMGIQIDMIESERLGLFAVHQNKWLSPGDSLLLKIK